MRRVLAVGLLDPVGDRVRRGRGRGRGQAGGRSLEAREILERLGLWATRFTPSVAVVPSEGPALIRGAPGVHPPMLLLDPTGCEHLWGGASGWLAAVTGGVGRLGFAAVAGLADTVGAAWGVAACLAGGGRVTPSDAGPVVVADDAVLHRLPVWALRVRPAVVAAFAEVGVDRVGQVLALPRAEVGQRFGTEVLARLDEVFGRRAEVVDLLREREPLRVVRVFAGPVAQLEVLGCVVLEMLRELAGLLLGRESGVRVLRLRCRWCGDDGRVVWREQRLRLVESTRDPDHLWRLLEPRLARWLEPASVVRRARRTGNVPGGVEEVELTAERVSRRTHHQSGLPGASQGVGPDPRPGVGVIPEVVRSIDDKAQPGRGVVDLLRERLGPEQVRRCYWVDDHVPEAAVRWQPVREDACSHGDTHRLRDPGRFGGGSAGHDHRDGSGDGDGPPLRWTRPNRIIQPRGVEVVLMQPEGPVMALRWGGWQTEVVSAIGPERIARRWWLGGVTAEELGWRSPDPHGVPADHPAGSTDSQRTDSSEPMAPVDLKPEVELQEQPLPSEGGTAGGAARSYYRLQDASGVWWWVFRCVRTQQWFVQGWW